MCSFTRLPYISKCCCFVSNRIGAYLIGMLQLASGLSIMIYVLTSRLTGKQDADHSDNDGDDDQNDQNAILCIMGSVFTLFGVMLLLGVKVKNLLLMRVYIVLEIIGLIVGLIIYIIILINLFLAFVVASEDTSNFVADLIRIFAIATAQVLVVVIVIVFAVIALKAYFLLCINSFLKELIKLKSGTPLAVGYTTVAELDVNTTKV